MTCHTLTHQLLIPCVAYAVMLGMLGTFNTWVVAIPQIKGTGLGASRLKDDPRLEYQGPHALSGLKQSPQSDWKEFRGGTQVHFCWSFAVWVRSAYVAAV